MRLPDTTVIGVAIGTGIVRISITVMCLFLSTVSGGGSTHGTTIPTMVTAVTRMTIHMITPTTLAGIPMMELNMPLRVHTAMEFSAQYSQSSPTLGIITAQSTEVSVMKARRLWPSTNRIRT